MLTLCIKLYYIKNKNHKFYGTSWGYDLGEKSSYVDFIDIKDYTFNFRRVSWSYMRRAYGKFSWEYR